MRKEKYKVTRKEKKRKKTANKELKEEKKIYERMRN